MQDYDNNFSGPNDFIQCMNRGCEIEFLYEGKAFGMIKRKGKIIVYEAGKEQSEKVYADPEKALEYKVGEKKLKDIFSEMKVTFRTF